jgi:hypothetical protein
VHEASGHAAGFGLLKFEALTVRRAIASAAVPGILNARVSNRKFGVWSQLRA